MAFDPGWLCARMGRAIRNKVRHPCQSQKILRRQHSKGGASTRVPFGHRVGGPEIAALHTNTGTGTRYYSQVSLGVLDPAHRSQQFLPQALSLTKSRTLGLGCHQRQRHWFSKESAYPTSTLADNQESEE